MAELTGSDFSGSGARFGWAVLTGSDFSGAKLTRANLGLTDLTGANLYKADLRKAVFPKKYKDLLSKEQQSQVKEFI